MNLVIMTGRLTADPVEVNTATGIKVAKYTLAVQRSHRNADGKQPTADFVGCTCFARTADFACTYLHKGTKIGVVGRLQTGNYERDGVRHYTTEVIVINHEFLESKHDTTATASTTPADSPDPFDDDHRLVVEVDDNDEELPF